MMILSHVSCGNGIIPYMNSTIPRLTSLVVDLIKIGVPVLLIIFGMLDLGKAVMAQKEDEIKKSQQMFFKRLLSACIVFFVFVIVELVFNIVAKDEKAGIWNCVNCFINKDCKTVAEK